VFAKIRFATAKSGFIQCAAIALLLVSASAYAQGTNSGLKGLREAYFVVWGALGIVPALMLAGAFAMSLVDGRRKLLAILLSLPAILYVPTALFVMVYPSTDFASKFPGAVGFALFFALLTFWRIDSPVLRRSLQGVTAAVFCTLLILPNEFWKAPLLTFEKKVYVNNLADLGAIRTLRDVSMSDKWLALEDNRFFFLVHDKPPPRGRRSRFPSGEFAALVQRPELKNNGLYFDVSFVDKTQEYAKSFWPNQPHFVVPLHRTEHAMYRVSAQSHAVLLAGNLNANFEVEFLNAIGSTTTWHRSAEHGYDDKVWQNFVLKLIELGNIDIDSPRFVDRAFATNKDRLYTIQVYLEMGMNPANIDRYGRTALHVAAINNHIGLARSAIDHGADPGLHDGKGKTALDLIEERFKGIDRARTPIPRWEALLQDETER